MQSITSNALEPTRHELTALSPVAHGLRLIPVFGLPILTVLLILGFSLVLPDTFPTLLNARSILGDKSIIALLALAAMIPMATGRIDLTVGYGIVMSHILAISLQVWYGLDWPLAVLIVLLAGALVGAVNGLLVEIARIDSFIATLGTGTVLYALATWHTDGRQVVGMLPESFTAIFATSVFGLPIVAAYVLVVAVVLWLAADYLPIGRYFYAIGANPRAAELNGIPTRRYVIAAFVASGTLTAFAGVVLAAKLRIGQASVGLDFLLPALVGAFLGSTTIKPGRVNVWGTVVGVLILAVGIAGIQQLGGDFYVEPLFNGATLILAIGIAGYTQRRRSNPRRAVASPSSAPPQPNRRPEMKPHTKLPAALALAAATLAVATPLYAADDIVAQAKAYTAQVTQPARAWDGPTTGPAAQAGKTIVYVSSDQRNGGPRGVSEGMAQAAKVIGWNFRILDGQNSIIGRSAAMSQAIALKPDGIMLGGVDTREQATLIREAVANGITVLGWHTVAEPGPVPEHNIFTNIGTDPLDVSRAAVMYVIAASDGKAGVVIFTDSTFDVAIAKSNAMADLVRQCSTCTLLRVEDTPLSDIAARMPQLTATFLQRYGKQWTWAMAINDLPFDFMMPTLQQAGYKGDGPLLAMSAGDGSASAFQRVRNHQYQVGTVAEPVILHGWQAVDEFNRAFAGQPPSGYSAPVHLVTPENIAFDGGANDVYDPDNGYQDIYRRIWQR